MKLCDKEYYEVLNVFERNYSYLRLDREKDKENWKIGWIYECGQTNELFKAYLSGYCLGKAIV